MNNSPYVYLNQFEPPPKVVSRLFCFHYAGGSASVFRQWQGRFEAGVEVVGIELPGRGSRFSLPVSESLNQLVRSIAEEIICYSETPFFFFGHSLGAHLAFNVAVHLQHLQKRVPLQVIVSGRSAPSDKTLYYPKITDLPHQEFIDNLVHYGGTPKEILDNKELMEIFVPILRADFRLSEQENIYEGEMLRCPLTVFGGKLDKAPEEKLRLWSLESDCHTEVLMFDGDHFFIQSKFFEVTELVAKICVPLSKSNALR